MLVLSSDLYQKWINFGIAFVIIFALDQSIKWSFLLQGADSKTSYTASLYHKGENTIAKKIVEEAAELGFAIKDKDSKEIIYEAADLLYHALVGLSFSDISPDLVKQEIVRRFGLSGIEEKNSRQEK